MVNFSVIVPLYNTENYIAECLNSILAQTYPHFEIVVIDDGSTDNSVQIVKSYNDQRIKLYSQVNRGLFHARLSGVAKAEKQYCLYVDADDLIADNLLETLAKEFEQGAECIVYDLLPFQGEKVSVKSNVIEEKIVWEGEQAKHPLALLLEGKIIQSVVCKAFVKKLVDIKKLENYPRISFCEDALHTLELFSNTHKTVLLKDKLYYYRQNEFSMTHTLKIDFYRDNVFRFQKYKESALEEFSIQTVERLLHFLPKRYFKMLLAFMLNPRYVCTKEEYRTFACAVVEDKTFCSYLQDLHTCPLHYRFLIRLIKKQRVGILYILRKIIKFIK